MRYFKKGDTLIEVILAFSVFAVVSISGLALMNSGISRAQSTLQLTMARNAIDSQAEALRYINSLAVAGSGSNDTGLWNTVTSSAVVSASDLSLCPSNRSQFPSSAFILGYDNGSRISRIDTNGLNPATTFPRLIWRSEDDTNNLADKGSFVGAEGLWIEAIKGSGYYDFHIRACWAAPTGSSPTTLGTIVRLYDPR